jgi:hypothetical protein
VANRLRGAPVRLGSVVLGSLLTVRRSFVMHAVMAAVATLMLTLLPAAVAAAASSSKAGCGAKAPEVLAQAAGLVATRIYAGELASSETHSDQREVEDYEPLLQAVASGERAAVETAVTSLVYSGTHIVRLRVSKGSTLLADVGGPYIIAPISGSLRLDGRTIGHYVLSVQDDLGYVKLETRFLGAPIVMRVGTKGVPVEGLLSPGPASVPEHGPVSYLHVSYQAFSFGARSFPGGPLRISLLMPLPAGITDESCAEVAGNELGLVAQRISRRFPLSPSDFASYIKLTETLTGGLLYIRSGSRQLAGSARPAPAALPTSGSIVYHGVRCQVDSFVAPSTLGTIRVYFLLAA